jgi:hypothetical protein
MSKKLKKSIEVAKQQILEATKAYPLPTQLIKKGTPVCRTQESHYPEPMFFNRNSNTRYGDPQHDIGVCYVAFDDVVAVAETLQHGQAGLKSPVLQSEIEERSLIQLETARDLVVVDAAALARNAGKVLKTIVDSKGQGSRGYAYTQAMSDVVMRHDANFDGILYPSQVYPITGSLSGCNLVLFEGRDPQLTNKGKQPLEDVELSTGETVGELLNRMQVPIE